MGLDPSSPRSSSRVPGNLTLSKVSFLFLVSVNGEPWTINRGKDYHLHCQVFPTPCTHRFACSTSFGRLGSWTQSNGHMWIVRGFPYNDMQFSVLADAAEMSDWLIFATTSSFQKLRISDNSCLHGGTMPLFSLCVHNTDTYAFIHICVYTYTLMSDMHYIYTHTYKTSYFIHIQIHLCLSLSLSLCLSLSACRPQASRIRPWQTPSHRQTGAQRPACSGKLQSKIAANPPIPGFNAEHPKMNPLKPKLLG